LKEDKSIYFSGLNSLRFIAALAVIITHLELLKGVFNYNNCYNNVVIFNLGGLGVYFFFVLSGFLITYLLLAEKKTSNNINIKKFYYRRIFKIWPLYYFIVILGFFVLPNFDFFKISYLQENFINNFYSNLLLYVLILPNIAFSFFSAVPNIGQAWSIGIEEQFYIFWPWVVSKTNNLLKSLLYIILGIIIIKIIVLMIGQYHQSNMIYLAIKKSIAMSKFECMAIGGIGAKLLIDNHQLLNLVYNKISINISLVLIILLIFLTPDKIQDGIHIVYSILFLIIILNVSNNSVKINLENKVLNYLGKISYGIYMYHFMIIPPILYFLKRFNNIESEIVLNILIYMLSIGLSILISSISYEYFEKHFILMKSKFSVIKSGIKNNTIT
jgi:peptidoglycan/LPS O-acetylase OafA/YrhL